MTYRESDGDAASFLRSAIDVDGTVVLIDCPFHKAQSEPRSVEAIRTRWIRAVKPFKDEGESFRRDAGSVIRHFKNCVLSIPCDA